VSPALRNVVAGVAIIVAGAGSFAYWRMKATNGVDVEAARTALAEDVRIVCTPPATRPAAPAGGHALREDEARSIMVRLASAPSVRDACSAELMANDAFEAVCDEALAASQADVDLLRASLRSDQPTLAYAVRAPLVDVATDEDGHPVESGPTAHGGFVAFTWSERIYLARDVRRLGGKTGGPFDGVPSLDRCTELATLAHDLWSVGDLMATFYAEPLVADVATSCPAPRAQASADARRAFDDVVNAPAPPIGDILRRDFSGVSLLHFGALASGKPPCDLAAALVEKGPHPTTSPELDALAQDWRQATITSASWRADPEHDETTKKYADKYAAMAARLRSASAAPPGE
jgi:hypothetical protein